MGADAVIGTHPHCIRGVETYNSAPLVYSLGDFAADTADPEFLRDHVARTALTKLGFPIDDPTICRFSLAADLLVLGKHQVECRLRPIRVAEDFLPREATPDEERMYREKLTGLSEAIGDPQSRPMQRVRDIEKSYRAKYGSGRTWKHWMTLPFRIRLKHLTSWWRSLTRSASYKKR